MKKQTINIGEDFNKKKGILEAYTYYNEFKTLDQCYGRYSGRKEYIYDYYYDLLGKNSDKVFNYGIRSYNSNVIILHAIIEKDGKRYYLLITPSYNWYTDMEEI